jgi:hypothetical protein
MSSLHSIPRNLAKTGWSFGAFTIQALNQAESFVIVFVRVHAASVNHVAKANGQHQSHSAAVASKMGLDAVSNGARSHHLLLARNCR